MSYLKHPPFRPPLLQFQAGLISGVAPPLATCQTRTAASFFGAHVRTRTTCMQLSTTRSAACPASASERLSSTLAVGALYLDPQLFLFVVIPPHR